MRSFFPLILIASLTAGCENPARFWAFVTALSEGESAEVNHFLQPTPGGADGEADGTGEAAAGGTSPGTSSAASDANGSGSSGGSPGLDG